MCTALLALLSWWVHLLPAKTGTVPRTSAQFAGALIPCLTPFRRISSSPSYTNLNFYQTQAEPHREKRDRFMPEKRPEKQTRSITLDPRRMHALNFPIWASRCLEYSSVPRLSLRMRPSVSLQSKFVDIETTTFALLPSWWIVFVFQFVAMMSWARLRAIVRNIPMKLFIVTTVMRLVRMLFTNLLNFLLIGILGEKFLSCLCTKNRFTAHEQLIYFSLSHGHWIL